MRKKSLGRKIREVVGDITQMREMTNKMVPTIILLRNQLSPLFPDLRDISTSLIVSR